jgi:predicted amino acid-binding ACT domain protein
MFGEDTFYYGWGAGHPTGVAVVSDLMRVAREIRSGSPERVSPFAHERLGEYPPAPVTLQRRAYYLRFRVNDRPGIIAALAGILAGQNIGLDAVLQEPCDTKHDLPFVITVEPTSESELASILERMRAAQSKWRDVPVSERVEICRGFVDAFRSSKESVALDITRQMGKPLVQARREVDTMLDRAQTMLRLAAAALQDDELPPKEGFRRFIRHEPLGIVLEIPAWNYPLLIAVNVVIPAQSNGAASVEPRLSGTAASASTGATMYC